jgi:hypothetical protein
MAQNPAEFTLQMQLMLREAQTRLEDGARLDSDLTRASDSGYLLRLLGFELVLKACVKAHGAPVRRSHSYFDLWGMLPANVQRRLVEAAQHRMAGVADYSDVPTLLRTWGRNFVRLRYPYEVYEGLTADEYHAKGEAWLAAGALESEADFAYYPSELRGLVEALLNEGKTWLDEAS